MVSAKFTDQTPELSHDRDEIGSLVEAVDLCHDLAEKLGAEGFTLLFAAAQGDARRLVPLFDETFPGISSLTRALTGPDTANFGRQVSTTTCPMWWRAKGAASFLDASARVWSIEAVPPVTGSSIIIFPVSSDGRRNGAIVFAGNDMSIDEDTLCEAHAACFEIFAQVAQLRKQDGNTQRPMSKRELECLRLTANGLTSDEIATALGLSVHTANQYLTNSTQKLNAVNRIHAVAKALRCGMIA